MSPFFQNILLYPLINLEGFRIAPLNIFIFIGLYFAGKLLIKYLKRLFNMRDLTDKRFTVEGKEIPIWRLTKQIIWIFIIYGAFKSLSINNSNVGLSYFLSYEFFRFDKFYFAVFHIFLGIFIYFSGRIFLSLLRLYFSNRERRSENIHTGTYYVYFQLVKYVVITLGVIFMLRSLGVELSRFMEALLALSLAIALGVQDIFKDFFSGLLLLFEGSVKMGDIIEIERPDSKDFFVAKVLEINMRTSKVETRDGKMLIIPNSHLTFQKVNNWSSGDQVTRFMIPVAVSYSADLDKVKEILIAAAQSHGKVVSNKKVVVRLLNFGDNGYELDLVFWADKNFFIEIHKSDIRFEIDRKFKAAGIEYPYPQMDVHFDRQTKTLD